MAVHGSHPALAAPLPPSPLQRDGRLSLVRWSTLRDDLEGWLRESAGNPDLLVDSVTTPVRTGAELAEPWRADKYPSENADDLEGVVPLDVVLREAPDAAAHRLPVVCKARRRGGLGRTLLPGLYRKADIRLSRDLADYPAMEELLTCADREIAVYRLQEDHEAFAGFLPQRIADRLDADADRYLLLMERVDGARLMDSAGDLAGWTPAHLTRLVEAMADLHAPWLGRSDAPTAPWPRPFESRAVLDSSELWAAMVEGAHRVVPSAMSGALYASAQKLAASVEQWYPVHDELPRTLVHDDFNQRNACFRPDGTPLVYDWELALVDVPQRDLVELLTFSLRPDDDEELVRALVESHRARLSDRLGVQLDPELWWEGVRTEIRFEVINRFALQCLFRAAFHLEYTERIAATARYLLERFC